MANDMNRVIFYRCPMSLSLSGIVFTLSMFHHLYKDEYEEIKKAYEKKNRKFIKMSDFTAVDTDDYPRYTYHAKKSRGFADIFGGGG